LAVRASWLRQVMEFVAVVKVAGSVTVWWREDVIPA
jgi:hypothetical protein